MGTPSMMFLRRILDLPSTSMSNVSVMTNTLLLRELRTPFLAPSSSKVQMIIQLHKAKKLSEMDFVQLKILWMTNVSFQELVLSNLLVVSISTTGPKPQLQVKLNLVLTHMLMLFWLFQELLL